ncbi:alpha/beta fold hydrolase [Actinoplanes sp. OR16]|uniref:alpha/beta fold hydrolase n=1 Tax=Actinoplanes sp. OR16 TaxID=946334 RepID=UPI001E39AA2A|nr:alpha/beta hydrolase [Actinoplanes sp. OR16]
MLLHGLTFDRRQWAPLLTYLPGRRVLALDLPGHGQSPSQKSYRMPGVADLVNRAVVAAGIDRPIIVGHSIGAIVATTYASRFPAHAVVNLDQPLLPGPFGALIRNAEETLRGPAWRTVWDGLVAGMGVDALPTAAWSLVERTSRPRADLLLGYWEEILRCTDAEIEEQRRKDLTVLADNQTGYRWVSSSRPSSSYEGWLRGALPDLEITVLEGGHFPHLAHPADIASLL